MRTTLSIDDDILVAAKQPAEREHMSVDAVISNLARQGLARTADATPVERNGIPLLRVRENALPATPELVDCLRDEQP